MSTKKAILATIAYHDIFDYPLKKAEIFQYLINKKSTLNEVNRSIKFLIKEKNISSKLEYFFQFKKVKLVQTRIKREKYSQAKLHKAYFYAKILRLVPTIKCVCLTGALAMNNCKKNDDIDFLIICQKKSLWTTRFFANILLFAFKRTPKNKNINNKACLNIFLDESDLTIKNQNLYTAHEISQMKLLWGFNNSYLRLIKKNNWILNFLPNWQPEKRQVKSNKQKVHIHLSLIRRKALLITYHLSLVEIFLKNFQLSYMKSKITTETVGDTQLFFHPGNTQSVILKKFNQKISKL